MLILPLRDGGQISQCTYQSSAITRFCHAARHNDLLTVDNLLKEDAFLAVSSDHDGTTALHAAAAGGHTQLMQLLIDRGASVDHRNTDSSTPLNEAAHAGHVDAVRLLLKNGAKPKLACQLITPLHEAALNGKADVCRVLLTAGADLDANDCWHGTPLHSAVVGAHRIVVKLLLDAGSNVNATRIHQQPLHIACDVHYDKPQLANLLLAYGANPMATDNHGRTALMLIVDRTAGNQLTTDQAILIAKLRDRALQPMTLKELTAIGIRRHYLTRDAAKLQLPPSIATTIIDFV